MGNSVTAGPSDFRATLEGATGKYIAKGESGISIEGEKPTGIFSSIGAAFTFSFKSKDEKAAIVAKNKHGIEAAKDSIKSIYGEEAANRFEKKFMKAEKGYLYGEYKSRYEKGAALSTDALLRFLDTPEQKEAAAHNEILNAVISARAKGATQFGLTTVTAAAKKEKLELAFGDAKSTLPKEVRDLLSNPTIEEWSKKYLNLAVDQPKQAIDRDAALADLHTMIKDAEVQLADNDAWSEPSTIRESQVGSFFEAPKILPPLTAKTAKEDITAIASALNSVKNAFDSALQSKEITGTAFLTSAVTDSDKKNWIQQKFDEEVARLSPSAQAMVEAYKNNGKSNWIKSALTERIPSSDPSKRELGHLTSLKAVLNEPAATRVLMDGLKMDQTSFDGLKAEVKNKKLVGNGNGVRLQKTKNEIFSK